MSFKSLSLPFSAVILSAFATTSLAASKDPIFNSYDINTEHKVTHAPMVANLTSHPGDEVVILGNDKDHQRWLSIYSFDSASKAFSQIERIAIPRHYTAFDLGEDAQHIYFMAKDHIATYQPGNAQQTGQLATLQPVQSMYIMSDSPQLSERDFAQDINDDGQDDFILADFDQTHLWVSHCCGERHQLSLPVEPFIDMDGNSIDFDETTLYFVDLNLDDKKDVVRVDQGQLTYFAQKQNGGFDTEPASITTHASIYGLSWFNVPNADGERSDQSNLAHRLVTELQDINGDGLTDMVVQFEQSSGVLDRNNDFEVYYGQNTDGKLTFAEQADTVIKYDETLMGLEFIDLNNDNQLEAMAPSFELGLSKIIGALLSGSVDMEYLIFSMDDQQQFAEDPMVSKDVEFDFSLTSGQAESPFFKVADINGDSLKDLVYSDGNEQIRLVLRQEDGRFARKSKKFSVQLPKEARDVVTEDINADGKSDMLMHYGRLDDASMLQTVRVLIAN